MRFLLRFLAPSLGVVFLADFLAGCFLAGLGGMIVAFEAGEAEAESSPSVASVSWLLKDSGERKEQTSFAQIGRWSRTGFEFFGAPKRALTL